MNRIRYTKLDENTLVSKNEVVSEVNGGKYRIFLHLDTMTYRIVNVNQQRVIKSTEKDKKKAPKHINTLKKHARDAAKALGVNIVREIRNPDLKLLSEEL